MKSMTFGTLNLSRTCAFLLVLSAVLLVACAGNVEEPTAQPEIVPTDTVVVPTSEPTATIEQAEVISAETPSPTKKPTTLTEPTLMTDSTTFSLPERAGLRTQTSGTVPHVQLDVAPVSAVNEELFRLAFSLPGVEERETIVSLPGASGMWLSDDVPVVQPKAIVAGREFAHIHPDGSLHAPLPFERALEVAEKGWGERHPWADQRDGWEGFVMLYTPVTMEELDITFQLIVESYNHVTGLSVVAADYQ